MKLIYKGKTKDVYELIDGNYLLKFKDDLTGSNGLFDPGANQVGLAIEGAGRAGLRISQHFFELLKRNNIPTHFIMANINEATMTVKPARTFGSGVEVICRYRAVGSFMRRYGMYAEEGQVLDALVEFTLKDDQREDPPISEDTLTLLGLLTIEESSMIKDLTRKICAIIKTELAEKGIELYDIKLEFGRIDHSDEIVLIDEISAGNMRAYKFNRQLEPLELEQILIGKD